MLAMCLAGVGGVVLVPELPCSAHCVCVCVCVYLHWREFGRVAGEGKCIIQKCARSLGGV